MDILKGITPKIATLMGIIYKNFNMYPSYLVTGLESSAISDNKMYLSTKAPSNALEKTTIVDLIYNPLYIVKETTDGNTRHFVRARTMIEIARTEGLGLLTVNNLNTFIG